MDKTSRVEQRTRQQLLEALQDAEQRLAAAERVAAAGPETNVYRTLFETMAQGVFYQRADGSLVDANPALLQMLGVTWEQFLGRTSMDPDWQLLDEQGTPLAGEQHPSMVALRTGQPVRDVVVAVHNPRREGFVWVTVNAIPEFRPGESRPHQVHVTLHDITARKRAEAQLVQADRLSSVGLLAAGIAHEINNPLTFVTYNLDSLAEEMPELLRSVRGLHGLLRRRLGAEAGGDLTSQCRPEVLDDVEQLLRDAATGARRIRDIARTLGAFSRVERDGHATADVMRAVEDAVLMARNEIRYRARLVTECGATPPVRGSEGRLAQVFLNVLVNAAHAIEEGRADQNVVTLRTAHQGDHVVVEVRDTGAGIAPDHLDRLFEPFFTTQPIGAGSGLGLSVSRAIVEGYGGAIDVTSQLGEGSCFTVRLPVAEPAQPAEPRPAADEAAPVTAAPVADAAGRGRVLVVDDEDAVRLALSRMLRAHHVVQASGGVEAKLILTSDRDFDAILCDVMMADLPGIELHRWLVDEDPALAERLIFVTGGAFTPSTREYLRGVTNLRLTKPVEVGQLRAMVATLRLVRRGSAAVD